MKFRKKPVVIEAVQFTGENWSEVDDFVGRDNFQTTGNAPYEPVAVVHDSVVHKSWLPIRTNDWVVRGVQGEFYPCDPEVFELTYEVAE